MSHFPTRWDTFETSIFTTMSQAANQHQAINLAQGFPDFDGPSSIKEAAIAAMTSGKNQYAPSAGLPELRDAISKHQKHRSGVAYDSDHEVTVFSGATEALFVTIQALCAPGDELVIFEPFYDSYPASAHAAGAAVRPIALKAPNWSFSRDDLASAINAKTKAILLNTPHNPTGKVYTAEEMSWIREAAMEHDLIVITDEVYEELVFSPEEHRYLSALPDMRERTIVISSTSKTFSMTGWKIGYAFAPPTLTDALRKVHQFTVFCSATPLQHGMMAAFTEPESYYTELRAAYLDRRDTLMEVLTNAGFRPSLPMGSYFVLADYSDLSDATDLDYAMHLVKGAGVASVPVSGFYVDSDQARKRLRYLRFGFCKNKKTLEQAGERLLAADLSF